MTQRGSRDVSVVFHTLIILIVSAAASSAQTLNGTIQGRVVDAQGAVVVGATLTLAGRQGSLTTVTDQRGEYRVLGMQAGSYDVTVDIAGFKSHTSRSVDVGPGETVVLDTTMHVGGPSEVIDVLAPLSLDLTSASTSATLSSSLLTHAPINIGPFNTATAIVDLGPGINRGSALGGDSNVASALLLDGVDTRDPDAGAAWIFYNYNLVEEVQFAGVGAQAEYGGFSGAVVNTVTKSGGNRHSGLFEVRHTRDGWAGENLTPEQAQANPTLGQSSVLERLSDVTVQLGGPLQRNRSFFWASVQRYAVTLDPAGPISKQTEVSPRFNGKLTWRPSSAHTAVGTIQGDRYTVTGVPGFPQTFSTDQQTLRQHSPGISGGLQYWRVLGARTLLDGRFGGFTGSFDLDPVDRTPVRLDALTGGATGGGGFLAYNDRRRGQLNIAVSHHRSSAGRHDLKVGLEIERSQLRSRQEFSNHIYYLDFGGAPSLAFTGSEYDIEGRNRRHSFYAQDAWRAWRATLDLGVRVDVIRGRSPRRSVAVYAPSRAIGPRLGGVLDVTGRGTMVLKASLGRYYEGAAFSPYSRAVPGHADFVSYDVRPDGRLVEFDRVPQLTYRVDEHIQHFGLNEGSISWEQRLLGMRVAVTGIRRQYINATGSVIPQATWARVATTNPLNGSPLTLYRWANRALTDRDYLITNVDGFTYRGTGGDAIGTLAAARRYRSLMIVATRPLRQGVEGRLSYVWSESTGNLSNRGREGFGGTVFENPNTGLINATGRMEHDRTHEFKALGSVHWPLGLSTGAVFRSVSGRTYTPVGFVAGATVNTVNALTVHLEPRGSRRYETEYQLDVRVEKAFRTGAQRIGGFVDVQNVLNASTVLSVQTRYPFRAVGATLIPFEAPAAVTGARQVTAGARWSF